MATYDATDVDGRILATVTLHGHIERLQGELPFYSTVSSPGDAAMELVEGRGQWQHSLDYRERPAVFDRLGDL